MMKSLKRESAIEEREHFVDNAELFFFLFVRSRGKRRGKSLSFFSFVLMKEEKIQLGDDDDGVVIPLR